MNRLLAPLVALGSILLTASLAFAQNAFPEDPPFQESGPPPPGVTSWYGTEVTLPFGYDKAGPQVLSWALGMSSVQDVMAEAVAHGGVRRTDTDFAYSTAGYACAVIGYELPGQDIGHAQALVVVCTKMLEDGRAATNVFGGVYGDSVVSTPTGDDTIAVIRDDLPESFQVAVHWSSDGEVVNGVMTQSVTPGLVDLITAWWNTHMENQRYWSRQVMTDRNVAAAYTSSVVNGLVGGAIGGAAGGAVLGGGLPGAVVGGGVGGILGAFAGATSFLSQPKPKTNMVRPAAGADDALPAPAPSRRLTWSALKARYR